jgi:plastocyanin
VSTEWNVFIYDYYFSPRSITVAPGGMVTWVNKGKVQHNVLGEWGASI